MEDLMVTLAALREANDGVIEVNQAAERGVTKADLSQLVTEGKLVRVGHGQFVLPKDREDEMATLAYDRKLGFSHQSALYLHGLLDDPGERYSVTYLEGTVPDKQIQATCDVHFAPRGLIDLGRTLVATPLGNLVPSYDLERSVCDVAAAKDSVGSDVFINVITRYAQDSRCDESKLYEYGDLLNVTYILQTYLEVLLWSPDR